MVEELATQEKQEVTVYDTGTHVVKILEDHMEGAYYLDEIAVQASVYQSFQENSGNRYRPNHEIGQSSQRTRGESNLQSASAYDEVLAQQCQLLEDCSADALESTINHPGDGVNTTESSTRNAGSSSNGNPRLVIREDNIDSDSMSYEQLQSLEDEIGSESRGLSDELISYLRVLEHRHKFFSRKGNEECVICKSNYKRQKLITLPCCHCYHSHCIIRWLKENKACPICKEEVFG
ncbi:E3 ubiquitin-protein ligase BIG BROTHER-like [Zingiber officinale]|uniref:E3 ubiquitin-protein ligase BIG BROTHER-like n=1 Tax=Zingiber officinale TaxID=94328 RepID=UPI001C4BDBA1|nr:E3 ubiquitin-protein ligase BIG BROTHER-like [Zingiber officinale]XP_042451476.1 E3 ubiquitin-protein ligase BIG BROTHER-like [Zingiber officinale]